MEGIQRPGRENHGQNVWGGSLENERVDAEGKSAVTPEREKAAAKQKMESEITRLWESVVVAEKEQKDFLNQMADLRAKIASDEIGDARLNGERIKALREYEGLLSEVNGKLQKDGDELKKLEAQYQTVFGAPIAH